MVDQFKPKYLMAITKGLDVNFASWTFNTSMAISPFEIMMCNTSPKCKYMIGPHLQRQHVGICSCNIKIQQWTNWVVLVVKTSSNSK
jgi:hypothetical protein